MPSIFSINYGLVEYIDWHNYQLNAERLPNPVNYTYLKDKKFNKEKELRISLSAFGLGQFTLNDGSTIEFRDSLGMHFDFQAATSDSTIRQIVCSEDCDPNVFPYRATKAAHSAD